MKTGRPLSDFEAELMTHTAGDKSRCPSILMLCPKCILDDSVHTHSIIIPYSPNGGQNSDGPIWKVVSGSGLADFTFAPSYYLPTSCGLHGWVRNGHWVDC